MLDGLSHMFGRCKAVTVFEFLSCKFMTGIVRFSFHLPGALVLWLVGYHPNGGFIL